MSRYELRGTLGVGDEPDSGGGAHGPSGLSTDYHWEYGYDCGGLTYYAQLYDDVPDDDLEGHERERPLIWIGEASCRVETVEQLQREMGMDLRPDVATALREERDLHLNGKLDEPLEEVRRRRLLLRGEDLRHYLGSIQPLIGQGRERWRLQLTKRASGVTARGLSS